MANYKKITAVYSTGATVYCIVERDVDGYFLTALKTSFADSIAYPAMTEDANIKGLYVLNTNDAAWDDGTYTVAAYVLTGATAAPASDIMVGCGSMQIEDDLEVQRFAVTNVTNGVTLADDAITASKFDESTAFPLKSADTGATAVARTGADSDTLETLSDQVDAVKSKTDNLPASPAAVGSAMTLTYAYDAAKTAAQAGDEMDLVNAPNATAVTAIQSGLATGAALSTVDTVVDAIKIVTDAIVTALELDGTVYRFTENALEEAPTGGGTPITVNDIFTGTIEGSINLQEALMLMLAFVAGEATGGGTATISFRNQADTLNRITYTVDEDGNRTAVTLNLA